MFFFFLLYSDHEFDSEYRKRMKKLLKMGTISLPLAPSRGALPVRQWHRKDESKILAMKRLNVLK